MPKSIEIVTHCWAEKYPLFAGALCHQLSSLILHKPETIAVRLTICLTEMDHYTMEILGNPYENPWKEIDIRILSISKEDLGRRCIGRNIVAKQTKADVVWFTDVDHVFGDGCLETLAWMEWPAGASMVFPSQLRIHKDHETGDVALRSALDDPRVIDIKVEDFIPKTYNRAIGGVQIVQGDFARKHGYLHGDPKWQRPRTDGKPFGDFRDDIAYRGYCKRFGEIKAIDLPNLYRLRHTETTYQ